jgi:hypothetical protein
VIILARRSAVASSAAVEARVVVMSVAGLLLHALVAACCWVFGCLCVGVFVGGCADE